MASGLLTNFTWIGKENLKDILKKTEDYIEENDLDWLQGHWVYEQGNYKGHFIIQGDKITQYSSSLIPCT